MPPPRRRDDGPPLPSLEDQARDVIARRRLTPYAVARASVPPLAPSQVSRFVNRERGLSGEALGRVCRALGLSLAEGRGGLR